MLLWLFLMSVVSAVAGVSSVNVVGSTNVQTVLSYQAPGAGSCTLEVSEDPGYAPLVRDVDPGIFPGADSDGRAGNLVEGASRVFVVGRRAVEQGADGKWYSRALQADTLHYYRLHCGADVATGTFRTANIPVGVTYAWPVPQDPNTGKVRWPSTDGNDRNQTLIDPNYGTLIKRVSVPGDVPASIDSLHKPFASAQGTNWGTPAGALTDDGASATYAGATQDWLVLTGSALQNLADFYVNSTGLDSITVRIKGSSPAAATIDVCLTFDGATCRGQIRQMQLDASGNAKTLGGGPPLDLWGADALWPADLARNKNFGVMIRASTPSQTSLSIQYVEVDAAFSDMLYMPEGGFVQVCSATKSNGGYHCTFVSSRATNHMFWIKPETGEVRWLGAMIAANWGGPPALCGSAFAYFDVNDPNVYYCEASLNGASVLLKGTYTGNDVAATPGSTAPANWINLTPPGNTVAELIKRFNPAYDPARFPPTLGLMTNHYFVYRAWSGGQDSLAWLAVLDIGNGLPIGSGGTGKVVAATAEFAAPNTRWCGVHTVEFVGHQNWFGWDAIPTVNGGNNTTGPFSVKLGTDLPASAGRFTIQVSGEPSPYVMDAAVGDVFQLSGAPWPGWDFVRIVQKLGPTQWVVDRTVTKTNLVAHPAGTNMVAYCGARQLSTPNRGAYVYWDFLNDPNAQDASGTHWVVEKNLTGGHIVQRGNYRIMEATDGYSVVTPGFPKSLNSQRTFAITGNPQWRNVYANMMPEGLGNGFMQHESFENWAATGPGRNNWFVDMIPFIGTSYLVPSVQAVSGQKQVYRTNSPKIHPDLFPTWALCGARQLKNISPGPIGDGDVYTFCVGSGCVAGAARNDAFVNCPQPISEKSVCTPYAWGDPTSVCAGDMMAYMQSITQYFLDPNGAGLRNRVLTNALYAWHGPRTMGYFDTAYSLPDGSWVIFASWGNNGRKDLYMVKVPAQPGFNSDPHWGTQPVQQAISTSLPSGATEVQLAYGNSGTLGATSATQPCSGGSCSLSVTAIPMSLIFSQPIFLDGGGRKVGSGNITTDIASGVLGTGIGKPVLAAGTPVKNGFSFTPNVAPGAIVSIFGQNLADCEAGATSLPLPTTLCNTAVTFNGDPAFLFYASGDQLNAQMPSSITPGRDVSVVVTRDGTASDPVVVPAASVGDVAPSAATYTLDGNVFRAVVQNPDGTMAGPNRPDLKLRPLRRGETGTIFANGLGPTTPAVADGQAAPAKPAAVLNDKVEVFVNGVSEAVTFAGLSPGSAALYQVNFKLDPITPVHTTDTNNIWLRVNGIESPHVLLSLQ